MINCLKKIEFIFKFSRGSFIVEIETNRNVQNLNDFKFILI